MFFLLSYNCLDFEINYYKIIIIDLIQLKKLLILFYNLLFLQSIIKIYFIYPYLSFEFEICQIVLILFHEINEN